MILFKNVLLSSQFNQQISDSKDNDFDGQLVTPSWTAEAEKLLDFL